LPIAKIYLLLRPFRGFNIYNKLFFYRGWNSMSVTDIYFE